LLDGLDFFQLFVPPPFQLAGCKSIPGIHRVVLFEGLLCLIHQLLELAGQGGTLSGAAGTQFFQRSQTGFHPQRRDHL
jgi:hypothetical protein